MKIVRIEDGQEKVYVQNNDILYLLNNGPLIESNVSILNETRFDFTEYSEPELVEFFKNADWIIDFDEYCELSDEELDEKTDEINRQMNEIVKQYNNLSNSDRRKNLYLREQYVQKKHMLHSCMNMYIFRHDPTLTGLPYFSGENWQKLKDKVVV